MLFSLVGVVPKAKEEKNHPCVLYCALQWAVVEEQGCGCELATSSSALRKPPASSSALADLALGSPATVMTT